jgi:hypothetical protein
VQVFPQGEDHRVVVHDLQGARTTIGREPGCALPLDLPGVSREHCRIERPRLGSALRVRDLGSRNGTHVGGLPVPNEGVDLPEGAVLRVGEALFVHRRWTDEEASVGALPPLPGPVDTCFPPLQLALRRLQRLRGDGGVFWIVGEEGSGRSVVVDHLRALSGDVEASGWFTGTDIDFRAVTDAPSWAPLERVLQVPPLRARPEDIPLLIARIDGGPLPPLMPRLLEGLLVHDWPGNVHELRMMLLRARSLRFGPMPGKAWDLDDFPDVQTQLDIAHGLAAPPPPAQPEPLPADASSMRFFMERHRWCAFPAAADAGVDRAALFAQMRKVRVRGPG